MPKGVYATNKGKYRNGGKKGNQTGPIIFRDCSHELVKAMTVYVGKTCRYKTITPELMLFTVQVLANMCDEEEV